MSKFKVGDRVRVKENIRDLELSIAASEGMLEVAGQEFTISSVNESIDAYFFKEIAFEYCWDEKALELVEESKETYPETGVEEFTDVEFENIMEVAYLVYIEKLSNEVQKVYNQRAEHKESNLDKINELVNIINKLDSKLNEIEGSKTVC